MQDHAQQSEAAPVLAERAKRHPPTVYTLSGLFSTVGAAACPQQRPAPVPTGAASAAQAGQAEEAAVAVPPGGIQVSRTGRLVAQLSGPALAILVWDPKARIGGIAHVLLPSSRSAVSKTTDAQEPARYVDGGFALLMQDIIAAGGEPSRLQVSLAGGCALAGKDLFQIGQRNITAARKLLWQQKLLITRDETGGTSAREVSLDCLQGGVHLQAAAQVCAA